VAGVRNPSVVNEMSISAQNISAVYFRTVNGRISQLNPNLIPKRKAALHAKGP
jgi:hypothetical protein